MKKKSIMVRLGVVAMALTMITTSLSSGTLAKYTEEVSASTQIKIAKWNAGAKVGSEFLGSTTTDLGTLLKASASKEYDGVANGFVAPGMTGSFDIVVTGQKEAGLTTDVAVSYKVYIDAEKHNLPGNLTFTAGGSSVNLAVDPESTSPENYETGLGYLLKADSIAPQATGDAATIRVEWNWPYQSTGNAKAENEEDLEAAQVETGSQDIDFQDNIVVTVVLEQKQPTKGTKDQTT